jgi:hypothetical protein
VFKLIHAFLVCMCVCVCVDQHLEMTFEFLKYIWSTHVQQRVLAPSQTVLTIEDPQKKATSKRTQEELMAEK